MSNKMAGNNVIVSIFWLVMMMMMMPSLCEAAFWKQLFGGLSSRNNKMSQEGVNDKEGEEQNVITDLRHLHHQLWIQNLKVPASMATHCRDDYAELCRLSACGRYNVIHSILTEDAPSSNSSDFATYRGPPCYPTTTFELPAGAPHVITRLQRVGNALPVEDVEETEEDIRKSNPTLYFDVQMQLNDALEGTCLNFTDSTMQSTIMEWCHNQHFKQYKMQAHDSSDGSTYYSHELDDTLGTSPLAKTTEAWYSLSPQLRQKAWQRKWRTNNHLTKHRQIHIFGLSTPVCNKSLLR